ncbi:MAG: pilus assembly protein PilF, partial [Aestuariibacter sp.]|nr:pilus assembly protein PilF [Aestuariibacter sp.]
MMHILLSSIRFIFACLIVVSLYWSGLYGGFFFDDRNNILLLESIQLTELSQRSIYDALTSGIASYIGRPIAQLSFALNHYFSGFDPFTFKATNLFIHLVTGLLVYLAARRLLISEAIAGFAAMLWLVHPIQLTSVLYVVQRMTSLSTLFLLAGFLLHMGGRERGGRKGMALILLAWALCWPLSILSKEIGALFPLFILAWEMIIRRSKTLQLDRFARLLTVATAVVFTGAFIYVVIIESQWLLGVYTTRDFSMTERLLTEGRVLWFYLGLMVFPRLESFALYHDDILLSTGLLSPWTTLPSLLGLAGIAWLAWRARLTAPLLSFGIAWFLIGHGLESTILPLEIAHEHRNYLPSFGLVIIAGWALAHSVKHSGWQKTLGITLAIGVMISFAITTALRAHQFGDELRRTQIEVQHHPNSMRTNNEAANAIVTYLAIP